MQESKAGIGSRTIQYIVKKAENKWWSRLIKQAGKPPVFLTVDWDKWIDEDEEFTSKGKSLYPFRLQFPFHFIIFCNASPAVQCDLFFIFFLLVSRST